MKKASNKKPAGDWQAKIDELTQDLQRVQADFVNYRNRMAEEKVQSAESAKATTIMQLIPVIDNLERAVAHAPEDLSNNPWVQGVVSMAKQIEKLLKDLGMERIVATPGTLFDPNLHEAVMFDEGDGGTEVVAEELRSGYKFGGKVMRPSMVKVTHAK